MAGDSGRYRPSVIFVVTVGMLLVALACIVLWVKEADAVQDRLEAARALHAKTEALMAALSPLGQRFEALESDLSPLKRMQTWDVPALEKDVGLLREALSDRGSQAAAAAQSLRRLEDRVKSVEGRVNGGSTRAPSTGQPELAGRLAALEAGLAALRTKVDRGAPPPSAAPLGALTSRVERLEKRTTEMAGTVEGSVLRALPVGTVLPWVPRLASSARALPGVPEGWAYCDGQNGTPDLAGRVLLGTMASKEVAARGGDRSTSQVAGHIHHRFAWGESPPSVEEIARLFVAQPRRTFNRNHQQNVFWHESNPPHRHEVGPPPHVKVLYIIKVR